MRAPSKSATDDQIVDAIADELKPWKQQRRQIETGPKAGWIEDKSKAEVLATISDAVRLEIVRLRELAPNFFKRDAINKTRADAQAIMKAVDHLTELLSAATTSPELLLRLGQHDRLVGSASDLANRPVPRLIEALLEVRGICQAADENQPGADQVKRWSALIALRLVLDFSDKDPTAGSENTKYCRIAGLLYESATGDEHNLRHICQDVLRPYHLKKLLPRRRG
jgi:hypothetical protein